MGDVTELHEPALPAIFLGGRVTLQQPSNLTEPDRIELAKQLRLYADAIDVSLDDADG